MTTNRPNGPVILCTGGAISFLSGGQANIPTWADRMYLGWLLRVIQSPRTFLPRYWNAAYEFPKLLWEERTRLFLEPNPIDGQAYLVEAGKHRCRHLGLFVITLTLLIGGVFYLSWIRDPEMANVTWIPSFIGEWADAHVRLRTGIPFLLLGATAAGWLEINKRPFRETLIAACLIAGVVLIAEIGQVGVSGRVFDWLDILSGIGGAIGMIAIVKICFSMLGTRSKPKNLAPE